MNVLTLYQGTVESNRALCRAFGLAALLLLPAVPGAWAAVAPGVPALLASFPILGSLVFLVAALVAASMISALRGTAAAGTAALVLTFIAGAGLSGGLSHWVGNEVGPQMVTIVITGVVIIASSCAAYAGLTRRRFSRLWGFLLGVTVAGLVAAPIVTTLELPLTSIMVSGAVAMVIGLFLIFRLYRAVEQGELNHVSAAVSFLSW